jgi:hypothetical protein
MRGIIFLKKKKKGREEKKIRKIFKKFFISYQPQQGATWRAAHMTLPICGA